MVKYLRYALPCICLLFVNSCTSHTNEINTARSYLQSCNILLAREIIKGIDEKKLYCSYTTTAGNFIYEAPKQTYIEYFDTIDSFLKSCEQMAESNIEEMNAKTICYRELKSKNTYGSVKNSIYVKDKYSNSYTYPFGIKIDEAINMCSQNEYSRLKSAINEKAKILEDSNECKMARLEEDICRAKFLISYYHSVMSDEREVAGVSGYINKVVMYKAGQGGVFTQDQFNEMKNIYKMETGHDFDLGKCKGYGANDTQNFGPKHPLRKKKIDTCGQNHEYFM